MIVGGIDPGLDGALSFFDMTTGGHVVYSMPTFEVEVRAKGQILKKIKGKKKIKRYIDRKALARIMWEELYGKDAYVIIEQQGMRPDQSAQSTMKTGVGYGCLLMGLDMLGVPYEEISPQKWQKHFGISNDTKGDSVRIAERLFPKVELRTERGRALDGRSDACLIMEYGRRRMNGDESPVSVPQVVRRRK